MSGNLEVRDDAPSERDLKIYHEYVTSGQTQRQIGEKWELTHPRICQIVKKVEAFIRDAVIEDLRHIKTRQKLQLEHLFALAMEGWERSTSLKETVTERTIELTDKQDGVTIRVPALETTVRREPQAGDPRFLQLMKEILKEQRELFGEQAEGDGQRVAGLSRVEAVRKRIESQRTTLQKLEEQVKRDEY